MEPLLYLVHRIPYPPNKGDKIRSFNILRLLSEYYNVHLGAFVDNKEDWKYADKLKEYCSETFLCKLNPNVAKIKSIRGFITNDALTIPYFYSRKMQKWVEKTVNHNSIKKALTFSSAMSQYITNENYHELSRYSDFVDVDSDKWRQYAAKNNIVMRWIYQREATKLLQYEISITEKFNKIFFVSNEEAELFKKQIKKCTNKIDHYTNGVNTEYFNPNENMNNPYEKNSKVIVFTGAMDYWANVDAVIWFVKDIFPIVLKKYSDVIFYIVGSNPTEQVKKLGQHKNIKVTGKVNDIRPYLKYANMAVAPLRIARGIQNKVLEALAMNKVVIGTEAAVEGIRNIHELEILITNCAEQFAKNIVSELDNNVNDINSHAFICRNYSWDKNLVELLETLQLN